MKLPRLPRIPYWYLLLGPSLLFALGFAMNAVVIAANNGQMPVLMPGGKCELIDPEDIVHSCWAATIHLKFLADWILFRHVGIFSPGDFVLEAGGDSFWPAFWGWLVLIIKDHNGKRESNANPQ